LINNRQSGRRRGRGGGRPPSINPSAGNNRQDNRQRGNAAQLLEKYKGLARDMQMQGDRVQTEYYLQYADHYFRILNESRARYEEQRRQRGDDYGDDEDEGDDDLGMNDASDRVSYDRAPSEPPQMARDNRDDDERPQRDDRPSRDERPQREERSGRDDRPARDDRPRGDRPRESQPRESQQRDDRPPREERAARDDRPPREERAPREERPAREDRGPRNGEPRARRPRRDFDAAEGQVDSERIAIDSLPPAIAAPASRDEASPDEAPAPRRRTRRPRANDDEIAPAA
jgi:hypothetical protein